MDRSHIQQVSIVSFHLSSGIALNHPVAFDVIFFCYSNNNVHVTKMFLKTIPTLQVGAFMKSGLWS